MCMCECEGGSTLWVAAVEDGEGGGAVHLVLAGDDDGVQQAPLCGVVQSIGQGDGGTQVDHLNQQTQVDNATAHQLCILPGERGKQTDNDALWYNYTCTVFK